MTKHRHILLQGRESTEPYKAPRTFVAAPFALPPRDRNRHAARLRQELEQAKADARARYQAPEPEGITLEVRSDPDFKLAFEKLEMRSSGILLDNVHYIQEHGKRRMVATVFVPWGKLGLLFNKIERYASENTDKGAPKNRDLVESISEIRLAVVQSMWTDAATLFPQDLRQTIWWEAWVRIPASEDPSTVLAGFRAEAERAKIRLSEQFIGFPERLVLLAHGSRQQWASSLSLLNMLAELRKAKEVPTDYMALSPREQAKFVEEAAGRVHGPQSGAPAVCLLDTGVHHEHPLLRMALAEDDVQAVNPDWGTADHLGHGTEMAGIALYGEDLADFLAGHERRELRHCLESVKLLPPHGGNDPAHYGALTQAAVARAEIHKPRRNRVVCLPITADDREQGYPSSWSAAIDQHSAGALDDVQRLYFISAGNIRDLGSDPGYRYPNTNQERAGIEDPGQSWNAVTVGACTNRVHIRSQEYQGWRPIAPAGALCPTSRTSLMWEDQRWPIKPDIVLEGGNYAIDDSRHIDACDDLRLLTSTLTPSGRMLDVIGDTSAATAQAARMAAIIQADYPHLWSETIRGLLVHSARWTPHMEGEFGTAKKGDVHRLLRCYGYGVPDLERARWTVQNQVTLVYQGELQPFERNENKKSVTKHFHLHSLPWPKEELEALGAVPVTLRVTLSYFVEPGPGRLGKGKKHGYQSHGLRFMLKGAQEAAQAFRQRISRDTSDEEEGQPSTSKMKDFQKWMLGASLRTRGSIHNDWCTDTAAAIASCDQLAVFPVTGWWRKRPHLMRLDRKARYSLILSLETRRTDVDLYMPIASRVAVSPQLEIPL